MVTVRTDLGDLRESARRTRFEQTADILDTNVQDAIKSLDANVIASKTRVQRSITTIGSLPIVATDSILNINNAGNLAPVVPLASTRNGAPLTFKNLPGSHLQTLTQTAPDTLEGQNTLPLNPGASITLVPYNDGVNTGWAIE